MAHCRGEPCFTLHVGTSKQKVLGYMWTRPTLLLFTADCTTQYELYQLSQFCDVTHLPYKVHVWQMLIGHLVTEHLFVEEKGETLGLSQAVH